VREREGEGERETERERQKERGKVDEAYDTRATHIMYIMQPGQAMFGVTTA
jgi:hypothetical protein